MRNKYIFLNTYVLFVFCLLASYNSSAALWHVNGSSSYQHTTVDGFSNEGRKVAIDASNNVYVLSDHTSDLSPAGVQTGLTYYYVVLRKYSQTGANLSSVQINLAGMQNNGYIFKSAFGLELSGGNVFIAYTKSVNNQFDIVIAKYNSTLVNQWTYNFNPANTGETGIDLKVNASGVAYALVESRNSLSGIILTQVIKASATGSSPTPLFAALVGRDTYSSIAIDAQNLFLTGYKTSTPAKMVLIEKRNSSGTILWSKTYDGGTPNTGNDYGSKIIVDGSNSALVVGSTFSSLSGNTDLLAIKYSNDGARVWTRVINRANNDYGSLIATNVVSNVANSTIFVAGYSGTQVTVYRLNPTNGSTTGSSFYFPQIAPVAGATAHVSLSELKLSSRGNAYLTGSIVSKVANDSVEACFATSFSNRITVAFNEGIVNTGEYYNSNAGVAIDVNAVTGLVALVRNNFQSFTDHSLETVYLDVFGLGSSVREQNPNYDFNETSILTSVYPNPFTDILNIYSQSQITSIEIFDITGKLVSASFNMTEETFTVNTTEFNKGLYFIKINNSEGQSKTIKIIKQ